MHATGARIKSGLRTILPVRVKLPQRRGIDRNIGAGGEKPSRTKRGAIFSYRSANRGVPFSRYHAHTIRLTWPAFLRSGSDTTRNDPLSLTPSGMSLTSFRRY